MNEDGTMARLPDLVAIAQRHGLKIGTISDLIAYRRRHDNLVRETAVETVTSEYGGAWQMRVFTDTAGGGEHIVLSKGDLSTPEPVLVRMHAMNPLEDLLGIHPGRSHQLRDAMRLIAAEGRGVVVLLRDMGAKLDLGDHVSPHRLRQYGIGAQILTALGLQRARHPDQLAQPAPGRPRRLRPHHRRHPADPGRGGLSVESHYTLARAALRCARPGSSWWWRPSTATSPTRSSPAPAPRSRAAGAEAETVEVPGALELPTAIGLAGAGGRFDGFVALGCVIRGETTHYETVCNDASRGLTLLGLRGLCIGNGILTVENHAQAAVRADPAGQDKGGGAAAAAMHLVALEAPLRAGGGGMNAPKLPANAEAPKPTAAQARRMRSAARFYAVQALFQMEAADAGLETVLEEFETHRMGAEIDGVAYAEPDLAHFRALLTAAVAEQARIDQLMHQALVARWPIDRIDPTLRALFRAAGAELVATDTPPKVTINEYLDVAKAFYPAGKEAKFVNGVLDHMARAARPEAFA